MTLNKAIEILESYNKWRRDKNVPPLNPMVSPGVLGEAIDVVIKYHKSKVIGNSSAFNKQR